MFFYSLYGSLFLNHISDIKTYKVCRKWFLAEQGFILKWAKNKILPSKKVSHLWAPTPCMVSSLLNFKWHLSIVDE